MRTAYDLFEKSQLNQGVVPKFDHAVIVSGVALSLKKPRYVSSPICLDFQDFRSHLEPNDSTFPIELVLLDVVKAIRLVIDWCPEWWWRDLFFSRRIIEGAVHDFLARLREHRHLGVPDVLGLSLRIEDEPILGQLFRVDVLLQEL